MAVNSNYIPEIWAYNGSNVSHSEQGNVSPCKYLNTVKNGEYEIQLKASDSNDSSAVEIWWNNQKIDTVKVSPDSEHSYKVTAEGSSSKFEVKPTQIGGIIEHSLDSVTVLDLSNSQHSVPLNIGAINNLPESQLTLTLSNLPSEFTLNTGKKTEEGSWLLSTSQAAEAKIIMPDDFSGTIELLLIAEMLNSNGDSLGQASTDFTITYVNPSENPTIHTLYSTADFHFTDRDNFNYSDALVLNTENIDSIMIANHGEQIPMSETSGLDPFADSNFTEFDIFSNITVDDIDFG